MSCYHPFTAFNLGGRSKNGKKDIVIIPNFNGNKISIYDSALDKVRNRIVLEGEHIKRDFNMVFDYKTKTSRYNYYLIDKILIPCGHCIGCRLAYSQDWAVRCFLEAKEHDHNYFLTLTYDDEHYTKTLVKEDLQKFMKRLRRYFELNYNHYGIRFFACGEYGSNTFRPHYHVILFNCPLPDLKRAFKSFAGDYVYSSELLNKLWPFGFHSIGDVNFETCAYTARYILKKQTGLSAEVYNDLKIIPEFLLMSRRPGIAKNYYLTHKDKIYASDCLNYLTKDLKLKSVKPSRYFDSLYDLEQPEHLAILKEQRRVSADFGTLDKVKLLRMNKDAVLEYEEELKKDSIKRLKRIL